MGEIKFICRQKPKGVFMSKVVSLILVLVLFFGPAVNSFASNDVDDIFEGDSIFIAGGIILGGALLICILVLGIMDFFAEAETPDNGIRMVSTGDETLGVTKDGKSILNVLKHLEAGVTPNKDIYVGFRFQY